MLIDEINIINNFLSKKECDELIKRYLEYNGKYEIFKKRYLLQLLNYPNDILFNETINKYKIHDKQIKNIEIICWPVGEFHDWHVDTEYYNYTTVTYLNEEYIGGRTFVKSNGKDIEIEPKTGKYIGFKSGMKHKVTELLEGSRFVLICWY